MQHVVWYCLFNLSKVFSKEHLFWIAAHVALRSYIQYISQNYSTFTDMNMDTGFWTMSWYLDLAYFCSDFTLFVTFGLSLSVSVNLTSCFILKCFSLFISDFVASCPCFTPGFSYSLPLACFVLVITSLCIYE